MTKQPIDATDPRAPANPRRTSDDDQLHAEAAPLKQEGDALRDGSGSRHGQSPPNVDRSTER